MAVVVASVEVPHNNTKNKSRHHPRHLRARLLPVHTTKEALQAAALVLTPAGPMEVAAALVLVVA